MKFFEIWAARRARTKGAYFRETCVFRFAWRIHGSRCCTPRRSVVQRRYDAYNRLQGVSRCLNARPGAPRDSAPAAVYVVFGPALKKLWKQKFKLVMALPTSRLESFANWADFIETTKRNLGGSPAKLCPRPSWAPRSTGELDHSAWAGWAELARDTSWAPREPASQVVESQRRWRSW